jgi:hypothetical protein
LQGNSLTAGFSGLRRRAENAWYQDRRILSFGGERNNVAGGIRLMVLDILKHDFWCDNSLSDVMTKPNECREGIESFGVNA